MKAKMQTIMISYRGLTKCSSIFFRRNGLKTALGGRNEKSLAMLLQYLSKYINDSRFAPLLIEITDIVLGI